MRTETSLCHQHVAGQIIYTFDDEDPDTDALEGTDPDESKGME